MLYSAIVNTIIYWPIYILLKYIAILLKDLVNILVMDVVVLLQCRTVTINQRGKTRVSWCCFVSVLCLVCEVVW